MASPWIRAENDARRALVRPRVSVALTEMILGAACVAFIVAVFQTAAWWSR